jgi:X-X-X-Leu-X-X-Gly heptad repeat protein
VLQRLRVPIESDQDQIGKALEERLGMPTEPEREVDVDGAGQLAGGSEQLEAALEQHRHVRAAKLPHRRPP